MCGLQIFYYSGSFFLLQGKLRRVVEIVVNFGHKWFVLIDA
jgi:hypothetical protein